MSKIIAITSGKGGTGKSTVCAGLGYTLAKQGHRTLIIELDFGLRCLDIIFGVEDNIKYDLGDVLSGKRLLLKQLLRSLWLQTSESFALLKLLQLSAPRRSLKYVVPLKNIMNI